MEFRLIYTSSPYVCLLQGAEQHGVHLHMTTQRLPLKRKPGLFTSKVSQFALKCLPLSGVILSDGGGGEASPQDK